jgi:(R)-2-hydroxyacyl-CoA dehydratese activating ATPase
MSLTAGIDVGSTYTKVVIADENGEIAARSECPTGYNLGRVADQALTDALDAGGIDRAAIGYVAATGYGRYMVPFRDLAITELTAHAWAVHRELPEVRTLLDVGGQTAKAIRIDESGRVKAFRLNDKCAAGSGAFLEKTARYMGFTAADIPALTEESAASAEISSVCAVFAESEVINHLASGVPAPDICAGGIVALAGRSGQLVKRVKPEPSYALTGGLTRIPLMKRALEELLETEIHMASAEFGVFAGALGAALLAHQRLRKTAAAAAA